MTTIINKSCCIADCKKKPSLACLGCPNLMYCTQHYKQHRDNLNVELQILTDKCNQFHEEIQTQAISSEVHPLMTTIDEWEDRSIAKIRHVAQEAREALLRNVNDVIPEVTYQLKNLRAKVHQDVDDCEFVDTDIKNWTQELERLKSFLNDSSNLNIREIPTEFISRIYLVVGMQINITFL